MVALVRVLTTLGTHGGDIPEPPLCFGASLVLGEATSDQLLDCHVDVERDVSVHLIDGAGAP
jgi:hypothetical protein